MRGFFSEAFNPEYKAIKAPTKIEGGVIVPKGWQEECRKVLKGQRFTIISAPCGAGKSIAILLKCIDEILASGFTQKQLIIAPQNIIAESFTQQMKIKNGHDYTWMPAHNFIDFTRSSVIVALKAWLLRDAKDLRNPNPADPYKIEGINAVCSHQALAIVWQQLTKSQRKVAMRNLTISIDEAHHVKGVFDESNEDMSPDEREEANHLGDVVHAMVNSKDETAHICLGTATFFRGDANFILHKSVRDQFKAYIYSWVEHFPSLNIKHFRLDYRFYKSDPTDQAIAQIKGDKGKHIWLVYLPSTGNAWRNKQSANKLFRKLYAVVNEAKVLDLLTQDTQKANTRRFADDVKAIKEGHKPTFRVIVACGIGLEGMDYPPADRLLNLGVQNSVTRAVQVHGRPLRKYDSKVDVHIYNYIHELVHVNQNTTLGELLSDRSNAILTCMAWDDNTNPIMVMMPQVKGPAKSKSLSEAVGYDYQELLEDVLVAVEKEETKSLKVIKTIVKETLAEKGITEPAILEGMVVKVIQALLKNSSDPAGQNLSVFFDVSILRKNGIDIIKKYELEDGTIFFGDCAVKELKAVRDFLKGNLEEWFEQALAAQKAGLL